MLLSHGRRAGVNFAPSGVRVRPARRGLRRPCVAGRSTCRCLSGVTASTLEPTTCPSERRSSYNPAEMLGRCTQPNTVVLLDNRRRLIRTLYDYGFGSPGAVGGTAGAGTGCVGNGGGIGCGAGVSPGCGASSPAGGIPSVGSVGADQKPAGIHMIFTEIRGVHRRQVFFPGTWRIWCWCIGIVGAFPIARHATDTLTDTGNAESAR